jgi:MFS transporter, DHA2 family, methylenomycin A resistance protein
MTCVFDLPANLFATPTSVMLIAARAAQGAGAAILVPNSLALLDHAYPEGTKRGRAVSWWLAGCPSSKP